MSPLKINDDGGLGCPVCGQTYLHHLEVEIWEREADADESIVTACTAGGGVSIERRSSFYNPSHRRNGMRVKFTCECCHAKPVFTLIQHKGETLMAWEGS